MTLVDIREKLMEECGWYDKVNADLSDNGADHFINTGIQHLELQLGWNKSDSLIEKTLSAGDTVIELVNPRYIKRIYYKDDDDEQVDVEWTSLPDTPAGDGSAWPLRVIQVAADDDNDRTMYIHAVWHTSKLTNNTDYSFWTLQYPNLVILAAQLIRETYFRNSAGVNDFAGVIQAGLNNIYKDLVAEEMAGESARWIRNG
ncbi:MAG: hypothetical protein KAH38_05830 [Candidatus Hydrogenedentes bacterium]|nr:hypothetical protein [Candidatus Hydrogenedentota bacterium]